MIDHNVRGELADYGWLSPVRTALDQPVEADELSCPECESDDVSHYETRLQELSILCESCEHKDRIPYIDLI